MRRNRSALCDGCEVSEDGGRIAAGSRYRLRDRCRNRFRNRLEASILTDPSFVKGHPKIHIDRRFLPNSCVLPQCTALDQPVYSRI